MRVESVGNPGNKDFQECRISNRYLNIAIITIPFTGIGMKIFDKKYVPCLVLVLLCAALSSGCISPLAKAPENPKVQEEPLLRVTPETAWEQATITQAPQAAFGSQTGMTTAVLGHGVTISYPVDWRKEEKDVKVLRDYGRNVINIASFYSPDIRSDRAYAAAPNPDKAKYTSLSIDVDPVPVPDFERYFNLATLAVQNKYASTQITRRDVVLRISITNTNPAGYKSYELDFDTPTMRGKYIFTNVNGNIYIFAFRNPSPYSKEVEDIYKSIIIEPESR